MEAKIYKNITNITIANLNKFSTLSLGYQHKKKKKKNDRKTNLINESSEGKILRASNNDRLLEDVREKAAISVGSVGSYRGIRCDGGDVEGERRYESQGWHVPSVILQDKHRIFWKGTSAQRSKVQNIPN